MYIYTDASKTDDHCSVAFHSPQYLEIQNFKSDGKRLSRCETWKLPISIGSKILLIEYVIVVIGRYGR